MLVIIIINTPLPNRPGPINQDANVVPCTQCPSAPPGAHIPMQEAHPCQIPSRFFCGPGERCGPVGSGPIAGWAAEAATASGKPWGSAWLAAGGVPFPAHGLCPSPKACGYLWDVVGGPSTPLGVSSASLPPEGLGTEELPPSHGPRKCLIPAPAQPALPGSSDTDVLVSWLHGWATRFP